MVMVKCLYPKYVLPGEVIPCFEEDDAMFVDSEPCAMPKNIRLGPGLIQEKDQVIAIKAGMLHHRQDNNSWWIEFDQKRYVAAEGENVVGIVTQKLTEAFKVDIGSAHPAVLPTMAFEGASKKNRQNLNVGDIVYARVSVASKDMDPELECVNPRTQKKDGYGPLENGFIVKSTLGYCRSLLSPKHHVMKVIGQKIPFEVAVGMNGRIWVNASNPVELMRIAHCLEKGHRMSEMEFGEYAQQVFSGTRSDLAKK